jgi:subtilase family serine protease
MQAWTGRALGNAAAAALVACVALAISAGAAAGSATRVVGSTTPLPHGARVTGRVASGTPISFTVALQPRDPAALAAYATAVSTPGNPLYGSYLTVSQFAQRFGAPHSHVAAVRSALRADGLNVSSVTANALQLHVTGSAGQIEHALSTSLVTVHTRSGRVAYANTKPPTLPANVAGYVQGIVGLNSVTPPQYAGVAKPTAGAHLAGGSRVRPHVATNGGPQPCSAAAQKQQSASGLTADEIATAYQFPGLYGAGNFGQGQTVAVLEIDPTQTTDVAEYQACYSTSASVSFVNVDGGPGAYTQGSSDDGEPTLDIDQIIGLAPKASIQVYQANPNSSSVLLDLLNAAVTQNSSKVISSSLGVCEALAGGSAISSENTLLQEAAAQGQTFFDSSGDAGSSMCFQNSGGAQTQLSVIDPGAQPFATGVGGTTLFTTSDAAEGCPNSSQACVYRPGDPPVEGVWNDGVSGGKASGTGGGISTQWTMPQYQSGAPAALGVVNSNSSATPCSGHTFCREVPDISADGDPQSGYVVFSNGAWTVTGGTSASAPLWGALVALANASSTCRGFTLGFVNPALYQLAGTSYLTNFTDVQRPSPITSAANNDALGVNGGKFPITANYDMTTGIGSPIASTLVSSLCSLRAPVYTVSLANPGTQTAVVGNPVSLQISGSDSGGQTLSFSATGLPAGLSMSSSGLITGTPTTPGAATVTVNASDQYTNAGSVAFTINVVVPGPPRLGGPAKRNIGLKKGKPKLTFTVSSGSNAPALKVIQISLPGGLSFARNKRTLKKGLKVKSGGRSIPFTLSGGPRKLTIVLTNPAGSVTVTVGPPGLSESKGLKAQAKKRRFKGVKIKINVVDAKLKQTPIALTVK